MAKPKKKAGPVTLGKRTEAAKALQVTDRCLRGWERIDGFPGRPQKGRTPGRYPVAEIREWRLTHLEPAKVGALAPANATTSATPIPAAMVTADVRARANAARTSKLEAEAALAQIELGRASGQILDRDEVERHTCRMIETAKAVLLEIGDRFESKLPQTDEQIRELSLGNLRAMFREIADDAVRRSLELLAERIGDDQDDAEDSEEQGAAE